MRILHLVDPGSPGGGAGTLRLVADLAGRSPEVGAEVIVLGGATHEGLARRCDLLPNALLGVPSRWPLAGIVPLRRFLAARERSLGRFDLVHAWSPRAGILAAWAAPRHPLVVSLLVGPVDPWSTAMLKIVARRPSVRLVTGSTVAARACREAGLDVPCMWILPTAVEPQTLLASPRRQVREPWALDEADFVVGVMAEPAGRADARMAVLTLDRVATLGRRVCILLHHGAHRRAEAERLARQSGKEHLVLIDDAMAEPWRVASGLDAMWWNAGHGLEPRSRPPALSAVSVLTHGGPRLETIPGVGPMLWAMAAGVPVIAERADVAKEILGRGGGVLVDPGDSNDACRHVMALHDDRERAARIGQAGRRRIDGSFHIALYWQRLQRVYRSLGVGVHAAA